MMKKNWKKKKTWTITSQAKGFLQLISGYNN